MRAVFATTVLLSSLCCLVAVLGTVALLDHLTTRQRVEAEYQRQAEHVVAVVAVTSRAEAIRRVAARTPAGRQGRIAVHLPGEDVIGNSHAAPADIRAAANAHEPVTTRTGREITYLHPVGVAGEHAGVVEVAVPRRGFSEGFAGRFALLLGAGLAGTLVAAAVVRRRSRPVVDAVRTLADAAAALGPGDQRIAIPWQVPAELTRLRTALTTIARRWADLRTDERKLVADLSHRLRTPLTALRLDAEAVGPGAVGERIRDSIAALDAEVNRVISTSDPRRACGGEPCDLDDLVRERMAFWAALAEAQRREHQIEVDGEPALVDLSRDAAQGVLDSLLVNVFQHTQAGTPFAVFLVTHAHWVTLVVDDGGPGIADPEGAVRRGASSARSTGLGLDIARSAAESCDGSIHIERSSLGGARVRLRFPEAGGEQPGRAPRAWRLWGSGRT
ncbi:HAMP domain-containing sensor histidine kinase [Haloechinothrix sp. LS1_15]|uniref:sensor histidine kinase n=1 Tax=Haloechinothrix sp. LS1_15 TaxID=2652248 RepID=UPI002945F2D9|nr:HAMP domain-containing sensor histidine kinase [Haloechinothrix sp. LS1_15]MDV6013014.1 HAMP domain-containing histidine kinase [Haloechinothrix sp. LS1_15]